MPNAASLQTSAYNAVYGKPFLLTEESWAAGGIFQGLRIFALAEAPAIKPIALRQTRMLRSVLTLAACLATTAATAPRPALLQLRGGGGVVEEQPKTGKLWVARSVESSPAPMAGAGPSG